MDNTLYFNPEWMEALECLTKETRDKVISAIVIYQTTGQVPELTNGKSAFMFMKIEVDRRNRRLVADREKRRQKKQQKESDEEKHDQEQPQQESAEPDTKIVYSPINSDPDSEIIPIKIVTLKPNDDSLRQPLHNPLPEKA